MAENCAAVAAAADIAFVGLEEADPAALAWRWCSAMAAADGCMAPWPRCGGSLAFAAAAAATAVLAWCNASNVGSRQTLGDGPALLTGGPPDERPACC